MNKIVVSAFYQFTGIEDPAGLKAPLAETLAGFGVMGTVLLAHEGINGTIAGSRAGIDQAMAHLRTLPGCADLEHKESSALEMPFYRLKVRLKKEIVALGVPGVDPTAKVGTYVEPGDWNALISDPEVVVVDTRNDYEVAIGTFEGAVNPETATFRDFPAWFSDHRDELEGKKVAMFCTGGIRCEKATSFLKSQGVDDVFHLKGGILKYLETIPENESRWHGSCFVFDDRVSVGHGLELGEHELCRACRHPLTAEEQASPNYVLGVSCDYCIDQRTDEQRERYAARQLQTELAEKRGEPHVGAVFDAPRPLDPTSDPVSAE